MFVNKEAILESVFIDSQGRVKPVIFKQEFEKDYFSVVLSMAGPIVKFYNDDELFEKFHGELPDNEDGEVLVFFNTSDAIKILRSSSNRIKAENKEKAKAARKLRFERYGI